MSSVDIMQYMTRLSFGAAIAIVLLRMAVGFHFFKEGESKIRSGNFTSAGYFRGAKGELAPLFKGMLPDEDGKIRLCYAPATESGTDPELAFVHWREFGQDVAMKCRLLEKQLVEQRRQLRQEIEAARNRGDEPERLIAEYEEGERKILALREHVQQIGPIIKKHMDEFELFLAAYEPEINKYFQSLDRLNGFRRDGDNRLAVVEEVDSLGGQQQTIYSDIMKDRAPLLTEAEANWDALELELNAVPVEEYVGSGGVELYRPYAENPTLSMIDMIIPWHHVVIGILIFVGLFCRLASTLGAIFMLGIVACQLPWAAGAAPTYYQFIELFSLVSLAVIGAGRYAGFDSMIEYFRSRNTNGEAIEV